jgi:5'-nucleotidase
MQKKTIHKQPIILVTNDDGITAAGIKALINVAQKFGKVLVVAPDSPQSGMGHAITIGKPLRLSKVDLFDGIEAYQCSGTPADCVKLATDVLLKGKLPRLCISGINHGSNASINILYSGTMSAAMEGFIEKIPSIGFSFLDYASDADFSTAAYVAEKVIAKVLSVVKIKPMLYNVNVPNVPLKKLKGIKMCRQADAKWQENFIQRKDPQGKNYYWLTGKFVNEDKKQDTDIAALDNGFASIVPIQYDLTDYNILKAEADTWKF